MKTVLVDMTLVRLNYYALTVAILVKCSIETAFEKIQSDHPDAVRPQLTRKDNEDIRKFREEGLSWHEIARYYDAPWTTVYGRVRPRTKRKVI